MIIYLLILTYIFVRTNLCILFNTKSYFNDNFKVTITLYMYFVNNKTSVNSKYVYFKYFSCTQYFICIKDYLLYLVP